MMEGGPTSSLPRSNTEGSSCGEAGGFLRRPAVSALSSLAAVPPNLPLPPPPVHNSPSSMRRGPGRPRKDGSFHGFQRQNSRGISGRARVKAFLMSGSRSGGRLSGGRSSSSPSTSSPGTPSTWELGEPFESTSEHRAQSPSQANPLSTERCGLCFLTGSSSLGQGELSSHPKTEGFSASTMAGPRPPPSSATPYLRPARTKTELATVLLRSEPYDEIEIVGLPEDIEAGEVINPSTGSCIAHFCCAAWSEGVVQSGSSCLDYVDRAVCMGLRNRCQGCDKLGATIVCRHDGCEAKFHYPCASAYGGFLDVKTLLFLCPQHASDVNDNGDVDSTCAKCKDTDPVVNQLFCTSCGRHYHGNCLEPPVEASLRVRAGWQCPDCKTCQFCKSANDDHRMIVCDVCDKGSHMYCMQPALSSIPKYGWKCKQCRMCKDCGSRSPGSGHSSRWHLNYSICDSCYQQRNKGLFCPVCNRAYRHQRQKTMKQCVLCRKHIHFECDNAAKSCGETGCDYVCPVCKTGGSTASPGGSTADDPEEETEFLAAFMKSQLSGDTLSGTESPFSELGPDFGNDVNLIDTIIGNEDSMNSISESDSGNTGGAVRVPNAPTGFTVVTERHKRNGPGKGGGGAMKKKPPQIRRSRSSGKGLNAIFPGKLEPRKRGRPARSMSQSVIPSSIDEESIGGSKEKVDEEYVHTVVVASGKDEFTICQDMCVICGSFGKEAEGELIACTQCAQCYHTYCANVKLSPVILRRGWRCLDCTVCEGCGRGSDEEHLLLCDECDISFHTYCLEPKLPAIPSGAWRCNWCARCQRCNAALPQITSRPKESPGLCSTCQSLNICPRCHATYKEGDLMVHCLNCQRWSHGPCEQLTTEEMLETAADKGFHCVACRPPGSDPLSGNMAHFPGNDIQFTTDGVALTETGLISTQTSAPITSPQVVPVVHSQVFYQRRINSISCDPINDTIDQVTAAVSSTNQQAGINDDDMEGDSLDDFPCRDMVSPDVSYGGMGAHSFRGARGAGRGRRMMNRMGIGGFIVRPARQRSFQATNEDGQDQDMLDGKDDMDNSSEQVRYPSPKDNEERPIRKRRRRTRRSHLDDSYPDQLRSAFFGQHAMMGAKAAEGAEPGSPRLDEIPGAFQIPVEHKFQGSELSRMSVDQLRKREAQDKQAAEESLMKDAFDGFGLGNPSGMGMDIGDIDIDENMKSILDNLLLEECRDSDRGTPSTDAVAKDDLGSLLESSVDWLGDPQKTLEQPTAQHPTERTSHQAQPEQPGVHVNPDLSTVMKQEQQPTVGDLPHDYFDSVREGDQMNFPSQGFSIDHVKREPQLQSPRKFETTPGMSIQANPNMSGNVPPPSLASPVITGKAGSSSAVTSELKQQTLLRWEQDEPLGEHATLAPVLYANVSQPDLRQRMPDWAARVKFINKLWRAVSSEERQKFVQLARDNRAASRQPRQRKQQRVRQENSRALTPGELSPAIGQGAIVPPSPDQFRELPLPMQKTTEAVAGPSFLPPVRNPAQNDYPIGMTQPGAQADPCTSPQDNFLFKVPRPPGFEGQAAWSPNMNPAQMQRGFPGGVPFAGQMSQQQNQAQGKNGSGILLEDLMEQERLEQSARQGTGPSIVMQGQEAQPSTARVAEWGLEGPSRPRSEMRSHDERHDQLLKEYEELARKRAAHEEQLSRMRKQKKNLAAKQRQFKRNNQELSSDESGLLQQLAHSIQSWHKQVENMKKQIKQKASQLHDYEARNGIPHRSLSTQPPASENDEFSEVMSPGPSLPSTHQHFFPGSQGIQSPAQHSPAMYGGIRPREAAFFPQAQPGPGMAAPVRVRAPFPNKVYCGPRPGMENPGMMMPSLQDPSMLGGQSYFGAQQSTEGAVKRKPRKKKKKKEDPEQLLPIQGTMMPRAVLETLNHLVDLVSAEIDGNQQVEEDTVLRHLLRIHSHPASAEPEPQLESVSTSHIITNPVRPASSPTPGKKRYRQKGGKKGAVYDEYTVFTERVLIGLNGLIPRLGVQEPKPSLERSICPAYGMSPLPDRADKTMIVDTTIGQVRLAFIGDHYLEIWGKKGLAELMEKASHDEIRSKNATSSPAVMGRLMSEKTQNGTVSDGSCDLIQRPLSPTLEDTSVCFPALKMSIPPDGRLSPDFRLMMAPPTMRPVPADPPPDLLRQLPSQPPRLSVPVVMTVDSNAAKDIENIMKNLALLLNIEAPIEYQVLDTPPHTPEKGTQKGPGEMTGEVCRGCHSLAKASAIRKRLAELGLTPTPEGNDEISFCDKACYEKFAAAYKVPIAMDTGERANAEKVLWGKQKGAADFSEEGLALAAANEGVSFGTPTSEDYARIDSIIQEVVESSDPYNSNQREMPVKLRELPRPGDPGTETVKRKAEKRWKGHRWMSWSPNIRASFIALQEEFNQMVLQLRATFKPDVLPKDQRKCELCHVDGDGEPEGPGRLLNMDAGRWIHVNCALWSSEVYETVGGALVNVESAVRRGQNSTCVHCSEPGATLKCYKLRCENFYHFPCAHAVRCFFMSDKTLFCPEHAQAEPLQRLAVFRRVFVERDENHLIAKLYQQGDAGLVLRVGSLIFHHVGQLLPHQLKSFHTQEYIFPVGYSVTRSYWSAAPNNGPWRRASYVCSISDNEGQPEYTIRCHERNKPTLNWKEGSATEVWSHVLRQIEQMRLPVNGNSEVLKLFPRFLSGESLFGLMEASICKMIESLPGVDSIITYNFKYGRSPLMDLPLAVNPSGCARCEPRFRTYIKRSHTLHVRGGNPETPSTTTSTATARSENLAAMLSLHMTDPYSRFDISTVSASTRWTLYRQMKSGWRDQVYLARSKIQGLGLYAKCDIPMNAMIIEYLGEVIRNEVAERREKLYDQQHRGVYMFRIDSERVVDATMTGGPARYINHSCDPNCATQLITAGTDDIKIIVMACRPISGGEELTYDYQFDFEDEKNKISCMCGAPNCRKWMN